MKFICTDMTKYEDQAYRKCLRRETESYSSQFEFVHHKELKKDERLS